MSDAERGQWRRAHRALWLWLVPAVTILAFLAALVPVLLRHRRERAIVEEVRRSGGRCLAFTDPGRPPWPLTYLGKRYARLRASVREVRLSSLTPDTDAVLAPLKELTEIETLCLAGTNVTDAGLVNLKGLRHLRKLNLNKTSVTDAGLAQLDGLTGLEELWFFHTDVSDAGLVYVKGLTRLCTLGMCHTRVTGAGLAHLGCLNNLQELHIDRSILDRASVAHVKGLANLRRLCLGEGTSSHQYEETLEALLAGIGTQASEADGAPRPCLPGKGEQTRTQEDMAKETGK